MWGVVCVDAVCVGAVCGFSVLVCVGAAYVGVWCTVCGCSV